MRDRGTTVDDRAMTDTESSTNVQLVRRAYSAFSRGDIAAVIEAMHPEIEWHEAESSPWHAPGGHHGPQQVVDNVFSQIPKAFDSFGVEPEIIHDAGTTVIVEGRYRADAAGTDETLDAQVCHVWTMRDGKLTRFQQYTDTRQFAEVMGVRTA